MDANRAMEEERIELTHSALTNDAVLSSIFSALASARDLVAASRTCRQWARACSFDAVWETLYVREYGVPDAHERRVNFREQYQRALHLASGTYADITNPFRIPDEIEKLGASFDPVTGCLAIAALNSQNKLRLHVMVLEMPVLPMPQSLAWDPALMHLGVEMDYPLLEEPVYGAVYQNGVPLACHSGRCVFPSAGALLVHPLQHPGPLLGQLELGSPARIAALAVDVWMCVGVATSGYVRFWSLDRMTCFGEHTLRSANHADALDWNNCLALAPGPPQGGSSSSQGHGSSLVAIINYDRQLGPNVLILKAERPSQSGGGGASGSGSGSVSTLQVLPMAHPTSCCFSRHRLVVGSGMTRSMEGHHFFTATATVFCTTSWQKQGTLVSSEHCTTLPPVRLSCTPRVHAVEGVVVFEMPREQAQGHTVHAMNLLHLKSGSTSDPSATLILGEEQRNATLNVGVPKGVLWMDVSMFLSTPRRLLILSRNQLLEISLA